jgi:hypothetical protein
MKINRIPNPREHRRNHKRLPLNRKPHMTNKPFIQDFINRVAIENATLRLTNHTSPLRNRKIIRHNKPQQNRSAKLIAGASLGMSSHNLTDATTHYQHHLAAIARQRNRRNSNLAIDAIMYGRSIAAPHLGKM